MDRYEELEELSEILASLDEKELEKYVKDDDKRDKTNYADWEESFSIKKKIDKEPDEDKIKKGDYVVYADNYGIVIDELPGDKYLVDLGDRQFVFASIVLKKADVQPGVIVKPKNSTNADKEYVVEEVDPVSGKVKVKDKNTNDEFYMDKESLEIKTAAEKPYNSVEIDEGTEKDVLNKQEEENEENKEPGNVEVETEKKNRKEDNFMNNIGKGRSKMPDVSMQKNREKENFLTETVKSILQDPEIAQQIVGKLLDYISRYNLEGEFLRGVKQSSYGEIITKFAQNMPNTFIAVVKEVM